MHSIFEKIFVTALLVSAGLFKANGQFISSGVEIGVNAGTLIYQGDLSPAFLGYTKALHPAIGVYISKPLDNYFSLRFNVTRGKIEADESTYANPAWRKFRNLAFSSSVTELSALLSWDPFGKIDGVSIRKLVPYFFAGAGLTLLHVHRNWSNFNRTYFGNKSTASLGLGVDTLYKTPGMVAVLPVGAGLRYRLSDHLFLTAEATYRFTSSDYIDGFKYAGDPTKNDAYYGLSVGVGYLFGYQETACPRMHF